MVTSRTGSRLGGIGLAFSDRNFRVYSGGSIASWTSFFVQLIAVSWLTWELTESTAWLAVIALCDLMPSVLLTPMTGAFADRADRHKIMIATSALLGIQAAILAACHASGNLTIWLLALLVIVHGILIAFMVPAMYGTLPRFVGRKALSSAIAVSSSYTQFAVFLGPAFAGWLIDTRGAGAAFVINAVGYAVLLVATIIGMAGEVRSTVSMSLIQLTVPEEMRGRVMGSWYMMHEIAAGIGAIFLGLAARIWGLALPTLLFAVVALLCLLFLARLFRSSIRPQ